MRPAFSSEPATDFNIPENREAMLKAIEKVKAELGQEYPLIIGGERRFTGQWIESTNPGKPSQLVGKVAKASAKDADDALEAASEAFKTWRDMSWLGRASVLLRMAGILRKRRLELAAWMVFELDKPWDEAEGEVAEAVDMLEWNAKDAMKLAKGGTHTLGRLPDEINTLHYQGIGVGVVIPPWNFPLAILQNMTMAAVVTGNTVVLKPASNTPVIGYKMVEIMMEAGVPAGVVNFVPGGGAEIGDKLVDDPRTRFIAFTGSKEIGIRIFERGAKVHPGQQWFKRVTVETGGKDAIIVNNDADLDDAADGIVAGAFGFSGQKCSACSVAVIHEDVYDEVVEKVVALTKERVKVGSGEEWGTTVNAVVDEKQYKSILGYIESGKEEGKLLHGGNAVGDEGYYIEPTIIADLPRTAKVVNEEIFGPVLSIVKAKDFDEALDIANQTEYGLTGSVYAKDRDVLEKARYRFDVGNLYFNRRCTGAMMGVHPFGGMKLSGTNTKSGGPDYLMNFVEAKAVGEKI